MAAATYSKLVVQRLFNTVAGKRIALLGFAFKADTNDTRESPAIRIAQDLLEEGARLSVFDPKVSADQFSVIGSSSNDGEACWQQLLILFMLVRADAVLILTEWNQFKSDWRQSLQSCVAQHGCLIEAIADTKTALSAGLQVWTVEKGDDTKALSNWRWFCWLPPC